MRLRLFFFIVLVVCFPLSGTVAETTKKNTIKHKIEFSNLSNETNTQTLSSHGRVIEIPLPGETKNKKLTVVSQETAKSIPVLNAQGEIVDSEQIVSLELSDFDNSSASVAISEGGSYGFVNDKELNKSYQITPDGNDRQTSQITMSTEHALTDGSCGTGSKYRQDINHNVSLSTNSKLTSSQPTGLRRIELIVVSPKEFTASRPNSEIVAQISATIQAANSYLYELGVVLELSGVQIFREGMYDPFEYAVSRQSAHLMLLTLQENWRGSAVSYDLISVFGKGKYQNTFGLAFGASSCIAKDYSFLFATQGGDSPQGELNLVSTFAHEVGHFLGMSHDANRYAEGPSLMWPYFVLSPSGFSDFSLSQFSSHAGPGALGGSCFDAWIGNWGEIPNVSTPDDNLPLRFEEGDSKSIVLYEGEKLSRQFRVSSHFNYSGLIYKAEGLPSFVSYDPWTGLFELEASYDLVSRKEKSVKFPIRLMAATFSKHAKLDLELIIKHRNRPPRFVDQTPDILEIEQGEILRIKIVAADDDRGDTAKVSLFKKSDLKKLPGKKKLKRNGATNELTWNVPSNARGEYSLRFIAKDKEKATTVRVIRIVVKEKNLPPLLTQVMLNDGSGIVVEGVDPEGRYVTLRFEGLLPGMIVTQANGRAVVSSVSCGGLSGDVKVIASDGDKDASQLLKLNLTKNCPIASLISEEKHTASSSTFKETLFYELSSGKWTNMNCQGEASDFSEKSFGGIPGDIPVRFLERGLQKPALFRGIGGYAYFLVLNGLDGSSSITPFGLYRDIPVLGDYDGDGTSDLSVFRPDSGEWFVRYSSTGIDQTLVDAAVVTKGLPLYYPLSGDLDGDGKSERIIFYRQENGTGVFELFSSSERKSIAISHHEINEIVTPFVGDVDGDGKDDLGVRSSNGAITFLGSKLSSIQQSKAKSNSSSDALMAAVCEELVKEVPEGHVSLQSALLRRARKMILSTELDYDGDGASDRAVYRESGKSGQFYSKTGEGVHVYTEIGLPYAEITSGRFMGSEASVFTLFRDGLWISQNKEEMKFVTFGESGDLPFVGDFNGDGKSDYAVYRIRDLSWWIMYQGGAKPTLRRYQWGSKGGVPIIGDFNGDGASDISLFYPETGSWFVRYDGGEIGKVIFGTVGDIPVPADYNGDGADEFAIYRPTTGTWHIKNYSSVKSIQWGFPKDIPVVGDFNGDGKYDFSVWRPEDGNWYVLSESVFGPQASIEQFGLSNDIPVGGRTGIRLF